MKLPRIKLEVANGWSPENSVAITHDRNCLFQQRKLINEFSSTSLLNGDFSDSTNGMNCCTGRPSMTLSWMKFGCRNSDIYFDGAANP